MYKAHFTPLTLFFQATSLKTVSQTKALNRSSHQLLMHERVRTFPLIQCYIQHDQLLL